MSSVIQMDWFVLILVGIGTLLLLGEILVNMRGIFAILGIVSITLYFYLYLPDNATFIMTLIIYFAGLLLILVDGKFISDGTLAVFGFVMIFISVAIAAPTFTAGLYAVIGVIIGIGLAFALLKILPHRNMWNKMTLKDRLTADKGYSSLSEEYAQLQSQQGITVTALRPVGTIKIADKEYSAVSSGHWINKDVAIIVVDVDGTKILVKELKE